MAYYKSSYSSMSSECPLVNTHQQRFVTIHCVHIDTLQLPHKDEVLCLNAGITSGITPITDNDNNMKNRLNALTHY